MDKTNIEYTVGGVNLDPTLWARFSEIQHAVYLEENKETIERYQLWISTGKDEDAWS